MIHWELCKRLEFDHPSEWYMHKRKSVPENDTNKILWDFEIKTDSQILAKKPDLVLINKKKNPTIFEDFAAMWTAK